MSLEVTNLFFFLQINTMNEEKEKKEEEEKKDMSFPRGHGNMNRDSSTKHDNDGNGNLSQNRVGVDIVPDVSGNNVVVNVCSLAFNCSCLHMSETTHDEHS